MNATPKYSWLLFDADGTLFDYDRAEDKAIEGTFRDFSLPFQAQTAAIYHEINHQVWREFENGQISAAALRLARFERLFAAVHVLANLEAFSARYLKNLASASDLLKGAKETVYQLKDRYRLALITNGLKDVQRQRLARSAIAGCFEAIAISEEMGVAKPDPRYFDLAFEMIGRPARDAVLVIGDSLTSDIQGGINYGLDTCWFNPQGEPPNPKLPATYQISALEDLLLLLS